MFEIELKNLDFRKSLYFYIVDAKMGLRLGASMILNQELTYIGHWKKYGLRALASALIYIFFFFSLKSKFLLYPCSLLSKKIKKSSKKRLATCTLRGVAGPHPCLTKIKV